MQPFRRDSKRSFRVQLLRSQLQRLFNYRIHLAFILVRAWTRPAREEAPSLEIFRELVESRLKLSVKKIKTFGVERASKLLTVTVRCELKRLGVSLWPYFNLWKIKSQSLQIKRFSLAYRLIKRTFLRFVFRRIGLTTLPRGKSVLMGNVLVRLESRMAISAWKINKWLKSDVLSLCFSRIRSRNYSLMQRGVIQLHLVLERKISTKQRLAFKALANNSLQDKVFRMQSKYVRIKLSQLKHILKVKEKESLLASFVKIISFLTKEGPNQFPKLNLNRLGATKLSSCLKPALQRSVIIFWKKIKLLIKNQFPVKRSLIPFIGNFLFVNRRQQQNALRNLQNLQKKACLIQLQTVLKRRRKAELRSFFGKWVGCSWLSLQWQDLKGMLQIQQIQNEVMSRQLMP